MTTIQVVCFCGVNPATKITVPKISAITRFHDINPHHVSKNRILVIRTVFKLPFFLHNN
jgi:hypothetical protein